MMSNQIITNTVEELSHYFTGQLKCLKCRKLVSFTDDLLTQHLKNCCKKNSGTLVESNDSYNYQIIHQFRAYLKSYSRGFLPDLTNTSSDINAERLRELKITVKQFRCLFCNLSGNIDDWEKHAMDCCRTTGSSLWCTCLLCETLICGEQKIVIDHVHFKKDKSFFSLSHFPGIVDVLKNKLTNYYKFERKVLRDDAQLRLYCGACDWYLLHGGVDEHFSTAEHRLNANIIYDLFYCSSCYVIIYGDDRLFHSHIMSKQHVMMKCKNKQELQIKPESIKHRILLMTVKTVMDNNLSENPAAHTYYCDLCSIVASTVKDWSQHVSTNDHKKMMHKETVRVVNDEIKPFEYICVHCKLSIVGTIFTQIMHCTSFGHETIKNLRISHQNRANMRAVKETEALRNILMATVSESRNNRKMDGNFVKAVEQNVSTSRDQPSTSQAVRIDQKFPKKEFILGTLFMYEKDLDTRNELDMVEKLRTFLLETWNKLNVQQCKTNCGYCNDFSSNDSKWWAHLSSQPHIDKMRQHYTTTKSSQAIALFCHCCNISMLGPPLIKKKHSTRAQHIKKNQLFAQSASHFDRTPKGSESSNDAEFIPIPKDVISNGITFENTISQSIKTSRTNDELDFEVPRKNDVEFIRTQSMSSNASSKNDNDDKSEDDGDIVSCVLLNGEDNGEEKVSDHELNDSFSSEHDINSTDVASTSKSDNPVTPQESNADDDNGSTEIVKHLIIAKGIPPQIIKNKRICLETFRRYGLIKRIFTKESKPDWLYLMVLTEPEEVFNRLHQNIETLKVKLGTDELSIEYDTRNTDQTGIKKNLTNNVKDIFSNMNLLNEEVQNLMRLYDEESNSAESISKIRELEGTVLDLAYNCYGPGIPVRVFVFGSRATGLATKNSDVDIYLQIDNSFGGGVHDNDPLQQQLVLYFSKKMRQFPNDFRNIVSIPFARVPIVKFTHSKSNLNCDLSFKSGLSTMNSLLVKTYLRLDDRIRYLVCAVKLWMKENDLADRNLFTTYAQIWMVLFFLMQPEHAVVPTVLNLRNELPPRDRHIPIEGWNCAFPDARDIVWRSSCPLSKEELLLKFFEFYSQENLLNYVMCTLTGLKMPKKFFHDMYNTLPQSTFDEYKRKLKRDGALYYKVLDDFKGLCIQDPFDHCHNLTKTIGLRKFQCFINLCQQTVDIMKSSLNT